MTSEIIAVTPETLPSILWQNQPVITTELLAEIYGTAVNNIQMNFANNASRFIEGVHYFLLKGADLKAFKANPISLGQFAISKFTKSLYLWTERGTVRHAKILDTDNAWAVQDRLEDFYFQKNQPKPYGLLESATISKSQIGEICCRVDEIALASEDSAKVKPAIWSRFKNHFRISGYKELPVDKYQDALTYIEKLRDEYASGKRMILVDASEYERLTALPQQTETYDSLIESEKRYTIREIKSIFNELHYSELAIVPKAKILNLKKALADVF